MTCHIMSLQRHLCKGASNLRRLLTAEEIAAPRNDKDFAIIEDARFSEGGGSWSLTGAPVQVDSSYLCNR